MNEKKPFRSLAAWIEAGSVSSLRRVLWLVTVLFLWGLITHAKYSGSGDEPHYMMIAYSLAFDRDLDLKNNYGDKNNIIFDGNLSLEDSKGHAVYKDGKLYPLHDIGMPLLFAPYFAGAYLIAQGLSGPAAQGLLSRLRMDRWGLLKSFLSLAMIALTGFLTVQIFDVCYLMTGEKLKSFCWSVLFAASPPILSHSYLFFTEVLSALIAAAVFKKIKEGNLTPWGCFGLGLSTAYLFFVHARNIGVVAVLLVLLTISIFRQADKKLLVTCCVAGASSALACRTLFNIHLWGNILTTPHAPFSPSMDLVFQLKTMSLRFLGWLFDQEHGLLPSAPLYFIAVPGFILAFKSRKREFIELISLPLVYLIIVSLPVFNPHHWSGGWSPAARFLVPVMPFISIAAFFSIAGLASLPLMARTILVVQASMDLIFWQFPKLLWNEEIGASRFLVFLGGGSDFLARLFPSWNCYSDRSLLLSAAWILSGALIARRVLKANGEPPRKPG